MGVVVGKQFDVVYDDFSGGHFVGAVKVKQPRNTWVGANIATDALDGTLIPLESFFSVVANFTTATTGTAANATRPIWFGSLNRILWATNLAINIIDVGATPTIASIASATAPLVNSLPCVFGAEVLFPAASAATLIRYAPYTAIVATNTVPAQMSRIISWGQFVFGVSTAQPYTVYFSNPGAAATWTATDTFNVGASASLVINGWCVHQGNLWFATNEGWFVATGIPNSTLSVRQVTTIETTADPVSIDTTIVSPGTTTSVLTSGDPVYANSGIVRELAGSRTRVLNYAASPDGREPVPMYELTRIGNHVIASSRANYGNVVDEGGASVNLGATLWILDIRSGVWTRRQLPAHTPKRLGVSPANTTALFYLTGSPDVENAWIARLSPSGLYANSDNTLPSATVELAEYNHHTQFRVKEILAEVDYGNPQGPVTNERSISVAVRASGNPLENAQDLSLARSVSSTLLHVLPSYGQTGFNITQRRSWVRFNPSDGSDTFTASPIITLTGVKLRRVIMRCQEISS